MNYRSICLWSALSIGTGWGCVASPDLGDVETEHSRTFTSSLSTDQSDFVVLDSVTISGTSDFGNIFADDWTPSLGAVLVSPYYVRTRMDPDLYSAYVEFVASAKTNRATTPDVRCNIGATNDTKTTTSMADGTSRYLAAQQLFTFINAVDNGMSVRAIFRNNPTTVYNGTLHFTFVVTYADGGKESWIVEGAVPPSLVVEGNVPNSLTSGNGTVQGCP